MKPVTFGNQFYAAQFNSREDYREKYGEWRDSLPQRSGISMNHPTGDGSVVESYVFYEPGSPQRMYDAQERLTLARETGHFQVIG